MKWTIPAKTFLLGEYAAVAEESAIILTTAPCFELSLGNEEGLEGIHPDSPAGLWWCQQNHQGLGLRWHDPYQGKGGMGASSAQFLASYLASLSLQGRKPTIPDLLEAYYQCAWNGKGLRPSGYDVIAQSQQGCVYINKKNKVLHTYPWPFEDLSFFLIHTGVKLATHHHLQEAVLPSQINTLSAVVDEAKRALEDINASAFIHSVNHYYAQLQKLNLVAAHSQTLINRFKKYPEILAIKGCGALGADVLLLICASDDALGLKNKLAAENYAILATERSLLFDSTRSFFID